MKADIPTNCACGNPICRKNKTGRCRRCARLNVVANWTPEQRAASRVIMGAGRKLPPEAVARSHAPEARAKATAKRHQTMLGWCPDELLPLYRYLRDRKGYGSAARAMIEDMIPGTPKHAKRTVANARDAMQIKHERDLAQRY